MTELRIDGEQLPLRPAQPIASMTGSKTSQSLPTFVFKLGLGIGLLAWLLLWDDNWRKVLFLFGDIRPLFLLPFLAMPLVLIGASCLKWRLFLRERGVAIRFSRLFALYLIGFFFNNFLPSNFGGDIARAYFLGRQIKSQIQSLASVFLERLTGLVALVILATVAYALTPALREGPLVTISIAALAGGCVALGVVLWHPSLVDVVVGPLGKIGALRRAVAKVHAFHDNVSYFRNKPVLVARAMAYSFLFHGCTVLNVYLAALVLGLDLSLLKLIAVTPVILVIASLPLTPNSLGVWEWAFGVYLMPAGAELEQGLAVALLLRAQTLVTSLFGGALFLVEDRAVGTAPAMHGE
jgi:glycosyltransferase 2 family protein